MDDKGKTVAGLVLASVIGLGAALTREAGMGLRMLGKGAEAIGEALPRAFSP